MRVGLDAQIRAVEAAAAAAAPSDAPLRQAAATLWELRRLDPDREIWVPLPDLRKLAESYHLCAGKVREFLPGGLLRSMEGLIP